MAQRIGSQRGYRFQSGECLIVTSCGVCHIVFAIPEGMERNCQRDSSEHFHCPNGHSLIYTDSENKRLKESLDYERQRAGHLAAQRDQAEAQARAQKAAKTRIKNQRDRERTRVAAGVCPCCNRTFKQLARHMQAKHPDYRHEDGVE